MIINLDTLSNYYVRWWEAYSADMSVSADSYYKFADEKGYRITTKVGVAECMNDYFGLNPVNVVNIVKDILKK